MKNESAVNLGKLSAKARLGGKTKAEKKAIMKKVWLRSAEVRRERLLDKTA